MIDELLPYYNSELASVRRLGEDFARRYPKVAQRLRLNPQTCEDPHVERLIEAFAFLTARIQHRLDDDFPEIAEGVLSTLSPHMLAPVPSAAVVQFQLDASAGKLTTGYRIPRHARLESEPVEGDACRFRTCFEATLWPVQLTDVRLSGPPFHAPEDCLPEETESLLRLRLNSLNHKLSLKQLGLPGLRLFLHGPRIYMHALYELLFNNVAAVALIPDDPDARIEYLSPGAIKPVGFRADEALLPECPRTPPGYRLLAEFFAFPDKFLFADLTGLDEALQNCDGTSVEILIALNRRVPDLEQHVAVENLRLGCTPVVNLFSQTAEPVRVSGEVSEYQIVPDARRPGSMEIYSVDRVSCRREDGAVVACAPLYSTGHAVDDGSGNFWTARRTTSAHDDGRPAGGTDVLLSLVDLDGEPGKLVGSTATVETTCLNRDLPSRLVFGGGRPRFRLENGGPIARTDCLTPPTPTRRPKLRGGAMWKLVSHLSLNHLSIGGGPEGTAALRELLQIYDLSESREERFPLDGILSVSHRRVAARIDPAQFRSPATVGAASAEPAFCHGVEVTLELDEDRFVGAGLFLFASVLERFLGLYCSINSFSQLVLRTKQRKEICRWSPRAGVDPIL